MYTIGLLGGLIVDGKRTTPYTANLYIKDGRIARITNEVLEAHETVDVTGLAVTPGFIDIHSHSDLVFTHTPAPDAKIRQGVTTELIGNCGSSCLPAMEETWERSEYFSRQKKHHPGYMSVIDYSEAVNSARPIANYAPLVGHSNLRIAVIGYENRDPNPEEMEQLKALLDREMARGAFGMSLGLIYPPSAFCAREELVELGRVIAKYDGILAVHMRNEGPRIFEAVDEVIDIARRSGVHVQISHLKLMGTPQWGKAEQLVDKLREARAEGLNITCDQYPFTASSTALSALVPHWAHDGGLVDLLDRVENHFEDLREAVNKEMANRGGPEAVMVSTARNGDDYLHKTIGQIAAENQISPADAVRRVLLDTEAFCQCLYFSINQEDIHHIMKQMFVCVGSDGSGYSYSSAASPHPRNFAAFSQYFQTVREQGLHPLEDMVYKATGLTAEILGITDRGTLTEGCWADICVFDPETFASQSTFTAPKAPPVGMHHVLVNGQFAVRDDAITDNRPGKAILK